MKTKTHLRIVGTGSLVALFAINAARAELVGYWNFNEGAGTVVYDFTGRANNGTLISGGGGAPSWVPDNTSDKALQFHGYTDRVNVPITASMGLTNSFTIALWAKADYLGYYPYLLEFTNDSNGSARQWFFQGSASGGDQMYMWSDANAAWRKGLGFKEGGGSSANLAWHHYAFSYSGGVVTPYVDGVAKTPQTVSGSPNFPSFTNLLIGGKNAAYNSWEGPIDDVAIFNTASNAATIATIMNGTNPAMIGDWTAGGGGTNWNSADNWGGALPSSNRPLVFATGNGLTTNTNNFAANKQFKGVTFSPTAGAFTLSGNAVNLTGDVVNNSTSTQTISLTGGVVLDGGSRSFNAAAGDIVVNNGIGQANGANGLVKTGPGTLTLNGTSTYGGTTAVNLGRLLVNGSLTGIGAVSVAAGATLGGTGSIAGAVTVNGGIISPGASIESLTTGALTMNGGTFAYEMNSGALAAVGADLLKVTGVDSFGNGVTLSGTVNLTLTDLATSPVAFAPNTVLSLVSYVGNWNGGYFTYDDTNVLEDGTIFTAGLNRWKISYEAGTGGLNFSGDYVSGGKFINLTLTAVPEPGSLLALGCLVGSGAFLRFRRRGV